MSYFVGIDIGLHGGVAVIDEQAQYVADHLMPLMKDAHGKQVVNTSHLFDWLLRFDGEVKLVAYEFVHSFGHEARSSIFSFGRSAGRTQAVVELLKWPVVEPTPQAWKAAILHGTKKDKAAAIGYANARWPLLNVTHDGIADALCLAEFARRQVIGTKE